MGNVQPAFEIFDHTADAGIRIVAPTLPALLRPAGEGLYAIIGELFPGGEARSDALDLPGTDAAILLRDYLGELLYLLESQRRMVQSLNVSRFDDRGLAATLETRLIDMERSLFQREVKAITYHELEIRTMPGGVEATVIVDI